MRKLVLSVGIGFLGLASAAEASQLVLNQRQVRSVVVESLGRSRRATTEESGSSSGSATLGWRSAWSSGRSRRSSTTSESVTSEFRLLVRYNVDGHAGHATMECSSRGE